MRLEIFEDNAGHIMIVDRDRGNVYPGQEEHSEPAAALTDCRSYRDVWGQNDDEAYPLDEECRASLRQMHMIGIYEDGRGYYTDQVPGVAGERYLGDFTESEKG